MSDARDLWKRVYRKVQQIAHGEITAVFGQAWRGGKMDGNYVTIAQAATAPVPVSATGRLGAVYPDGTTIGITTDGKIYVIGGSLAPATIYITAPVNGATTTATPTIVWTAVAGATQYELQISTAADFGAPVIDALLPGTTYVVGDGVLTAGTTYYAQVRASAGVTTLWSPTVFFTIVVASGSQSASGGCYLPSGITYAYGFLGGSNTGQGSWYYIPASTSVAVTLINFVGPSGNFMHIYVDTTLTVHCDWALGGASGTSNAGAPLPGAGWYWIEGHVAAPSGGHASSDIAVFTHDGTLFSEFHSAIVGLSSPGTVTAQVGYGVCLSGGASGMPNDGVWRRAKLQIDNGNDSADTAPPTADVLPGHANYIVELMQRQAVGATATETDTSGAHNNFTAGGQGDQIMADGPYAG